jgi:hypothetical protein
VSARCLADVRRKPEISWARRHLLHTQHQEGPRSIAMSSSVLLRRVPPWVAQRLAMFTLRVGRSAHMPCSGRLHWARPQERCARKGSFNAVLYSVEVTVDGHK